MAKKAAKQSGRNGQKPKATKAVKRQRGRTAEPDGRFQARAQTVLEQLESEELSTGLKRALAKLEEGKDLTTNDLRYIARHERTQQKKYGAPFVKNYPKDDFLNDLNKSHQQATNWKKKHGLPFHKNTSYVDLHEFIRWVSDFLEKHKYTFMVANRDPENANPDVPFLAGGDSPALERWRAAKADLAEDERDERRSQLQPVDAINTVLTEWGARLRMASEQLGRRFGAPAQDVLTDALDDCEKILQQIGEQ